LVRGADFLGAAVLYWKRIHPEPFLDKSLPAVLIGLAGVMLSVLVYGA